MVGTALCYYRIFRLALLPGLQEFLQSRFMVADAATAKHPVMQGSGERVDNLAHDEGARDFDAGVEIERGNHGFNAVSEQGTFAASAAALFSAPQQHVFAEIESCGHGPQLAAADKLGAQPGESAFVEIGIAAAQLLGDKKANDGVAEKFELFVVRFGVGAGIGGLA